MESKQEQLRNMLFSKPMPDMPQNVREYFNMAFMFYRKYLDISSRPSDEIYSAAAEDMQVISNAYNANPMLLGLLFECYDDLERRITEKENADAKNNRPKQISMAV